MAQRFLSIKNFETYNPGSTRSYPWIKLYRTMLLDIDFLRLDVTSRYLYVCLLIIASDHANKIPMDVSYLSHRCAMSVSEDMLKPLYRSGFLQASRSTLQRLEKSKSREEGEGEAATPTLPAPPPTFVRINGGRKPKATETPWPEGFTSTDKHKALADGLGLNVFSEFSRFRDKAKAKGWTYVDWDAGFRTWLNNEAKYKQERGR
jgi:hypothetical protein